MNESDLYATIHDLNILTRSYEVMNCSSRFSSLSASRCPHTHGLQSIIFPSISLPRIPDVYCLLQTQPEFRSSIEYARKAMRQIRIYGPTLLQQFIDAAPGNT